MYGPITSYLRVRELPGRAPGMMVVERSCGAKISPRPPYQPCNWRLSIDLQDEALKSRSRVSNAYLAASRGESPRPSGLLVLLDRLLPLVPPYRYLFTRVICHPIIGSPDYGVPAPAAANLVRGSLIRPCSKGVVA